MEKTSNEAIAEIKKLMQTIPVSTPRSIKIIVFIMSLFLLLIQRYNNFFKLPRKTLNFFQFLFLHIRLRRKILYAVFSVELLIIVLPEIETCSHSIDYRRYSCPAEKNILETINIINIIKIINVICG